MAQPRFSGPDQAAQEGRLLQNLLGLYAEEVRLYQQVLELSRQQGTTVRRDGDLLEIRVILEQKRDCLDRIDRLEKADGGARSLWENGKEKWSSVGQAKLHKVLRQVSALIEQILCCEEETDRYLLQKMSAQ
ncbi:MAG: hypothetical protein ABIF77_14875 [bacterium]